MLKKQLTALLICCIWAFNAQAITDEETPPNPRYQVEIIIFETLALRGWTEEYWRPNPELIDLENALLPPEELPEEQFMLSEQVAKMTPEKGYRILKHSGWILEGKSEEEAQPIKIEVLPETAYESRLEGTLTFYKSRFAHVRLHLDLERKIPQRLIASFAQNQHTEADFLPEFWRFELKEARKIKSGELHYFDHPIYGVLMQIQYQGQ